ncbi:MAG: hypothetical protein J6S29_07135 [Methanosphaera sp.]|nr:hypothetical protein [Methanosphaera sp.]
MPEKGLGRGLDALIQKRDDKTPKKAKKPNVKTKSDTDSFMVLSQEKIDEIKDEVADNPRISLWSVKSASTLRYLKKTVPEFSISNEASTLLEDAISRKYPEIWELFNEE